MSTSLRQWIENDGGWTNEVSSVSTLKRVIVAYGLSHLVNKAYQINVASSSYGLQILCSLDNFVVRTDGQNPTPKGITGVDMIAPKLSLTFEAPWVLNEMLHGDENDDILLGRYLTVEFDAVQQPLGIIPARTEDKQRICHFLGLLLHELFSHGRPSLTAVAAADSDQTEGRTNVYDVNAEPTRKKQAARPRAQGESSYVPLLDLGLPPLVHVLVENLVGCGWGGRTSNAPYDSIKTACKDIHRLILEPRHLLFDQHFSSGIPSLQYRREKIYGREKECKLIADALCRLYHGTSEVLFIGGYSGSGKTRLVESLIDDVNFAGGFFIKEKLDLMELVPYSVVVRAFNKLCLVIKDRTTSQELQSLVVDLMAEFSSDFFFLGQVLPNIYELCPALRREETTDVQNSLQMNLQSVAFILRRFMSVVSSKVHPVMFFLDDMQWADRQSVELLRAIITGVRKSSFFFVGSYRDNEVEPQGDIFCLINQIKASSVPTTTLALEGINLTSLNDLVSDALCMFPRQCQSLTEVVHQKTHGNPLFVEVFLKSLTEGNLLQYSFREKQWFWNRNQTESEQITDNVLCLLSSKMRILDQGMQSSLKAMSCFGIKVDLVAIQLLSSTPQHQNLPQYLEEAVRDGYMLKTSEEYRFTHDKFREAAYDLIPTTERDQYHLNLALTLYYASGWRNLSGMTFVICDQLNKAKDYLTAENVVPIDVAGLFIDAGTNALNQSEYPRARQYFEFAESVLPSSSWTSHYNRCIRLFFLRAKSSYACGFAEEALRAILHLLNNCRCVKDSLDANYLATSIYFDNNEAEVAFTICSTALSQIHEPVEDSVEPDRVVKLVEETSQLLSSMSDEELSGLKEASEEYCAILKFYSLLTVMSGVLKPNMYPFFASKLVQLTVKHGVSEYAVLGFMFLASVKCYNSMFKDIPTARRIGKIALNFQKRFELKDQIPLLYLCYGFVGPYIQPVQACADMHQEAFQHGISIGNSTFAFYNPHMQLRASFCAGENLSQLLQKTEYYLELALKFQHSHAIALLNQYRVTTSLLMGIQVPSDAYCNNGAGAILANLHFNGVVQSFWLRQQDKFEQYSSQFLSTSNGATQNSLNMHLVMFYHGLNLLQTEDKTNAAERISTVNGYINEMRQMEEYSSWNFSNKVALLQAQVFAASQRVVEAKEKFEVAISTAHDSKFVHEEGLACEFAGILCLGLDEHEEAIEYYNKAKDCYTRWGSGNKVEFIERLIQQVENLGNV